jgi:hypothetical protein
MQFCAGQRGGFSQDDGPPEKAPADLSQTPDAVPRIEPFHRYASAIAESRARWASPIRRTATWVCTV